MALLLWWLILKSQVCWFLQKQVLTLTCKNFSFLNLRASFRERINKLSKKRSNNNIVDIISSLVKNSDVFSD